MPKSYQNDANIGAKYNKTKIRKKVSETCLGNYEKYMCLRKCKLCKSNAKTIVFEGFANWMQDDGNQQKYFKQYIKIIEQLMTNPCKIDARKRSAKNIDNDANMAPKWRSKSIKKHD